MKLTPHRLQPRAGAGDSRLHRLRRARRDARPDRRSGGHGSARRRGPLPPRRRRLRRPRSPRPRPRPLALRPSAAVPETDKYAAVAAVPAVLTNCTPNGGDTAWMLTSVALVLMMTIPGLGLFYGGMVRKKNVGDTVMTSFAITCLVTVVYAIVTYSLAFTGGTPFIGGLSRAFLQGILSDINNGGIGNPNPLAPTIPETVYMCFQMTFAIITPALIAGAYRGAHEVLGDAVVHGPVGDLRLRPGRPLAVGTRRHLQLDATTRRVGQGSRLRRRHGRAHQRGRRRSCRRDHARQAPRHGPGPQHGPDLHRRRACCGSAGSASTPAPRSARACRPAWR